MIGVPRDPAVIVCEACQDSGWLRFECTGDVACGRNRRHPAHTYAAPCPCRPINPAYQEKRARQHGKDASA